MWVNPSDGPRTGILDEFGNHGFLARGRAIIYVPVAGLLRLPGPLFSLTLGSL